ncbi:SMI1/KNR4 family protein [Streptomyces sp. R41]|uniref:SMI1/KNR4 family protein n=1 Tax=Streptomyces sp. R41 TaxID=3238632 RepID=A0AB39RWR7_9ACTN
MSPTGDRRFPPALAALSEAAFDYDDGNGIDYEPWGDFLTAEETTDWLRAWTGNSELDGDAFRVFGQDGTGGYAAFWRVRPERELVDQPVVFFGSEGSLGVVASDLAGYLRVLADGVGPMEAVDYPGQSAAPDPALLAVAERYAPGARESATDVVAAAGREFPGFEDLVLGWCR